MLTLRLRALPCALAAALVAMPSHALMLGEPQVRSYLGRPLDVRIPVQGAGADAVDASCFEVLGDPQGGMATLSRAQIEVEQQGGQTYLRVRSSEPMREPASILRLRAACAPSNGMLVRQYGILLDPMPASMPSAPLVTRAAQDASGSPPVPAQLAAVTPAPTASVAPTPGARVPAARTQPRHHAVHKPHAVARAKPVHRAPGALAQGAFHLKLSGPVLDLEPTRHVTPAERERLREARTLMEGDDYASAMLALRDRIGTLQKRLETLQAQAARIEAAQRERPQVAAAPQREPNAAARFAQGAWSWAIVALLGLVALLMPLARWMRRRKPANEVAELIVKKPRAPETGTETGRFAPPPPEVIAPAIAAAAPATAAALVTEDTEEAIRTARDLYNAGERLQAAGVLRLAIERHPERVAPWLPLFDLLMRERLATEYAELARGFQVLHGASPAWKTVQRAGQQIDPSNPLYADDAAPHQVAA